MGLTASLSLCPVLPAVICTSGWALASGASQSSLVRRCMWKWGLSGLRWTRVQICVGLSPVIHIPGEDGSPEALCLCGMYRACRAAVVWRVRRTCRPRPGWPPTSSRRSVCVCAEGRHEQGLVHLAAREGCLEEGIHSTSSGQSVLPGGWQGGLGGGTSQ